ncbi:MAG: NAD(P)-dependent oxidoreductase [Rhizomicrobium sp.]
MNEQAAGNSEIAIIGGAGFIGRWLSRALAESGEHVRTVDIASPATDDAGTFQKASVTDLVDLSKALAGCKMIINLAAVHRDDVRPLSLYHDVNVTGAQNVCTAATSLGIETLVFTSSVAVYGFAEGEPTETTSPNPFNAYGRTKWEAECIYRAWQEEDPTVRRLVIVRPTVVFGPANRGNVYNLIAQLARPRFVMVGDGTNRKSMAYVRNVAAFIAYVARSEKLGAGQHIFNYCDAPDFDMNTLLRVVRESLGKDPRPTVKLPHAVGTAIGSLFDIAATLSGRTFPVSRIRIQKFCANTVFSADRARATGFHAPYSLVEALRETIAHEFLRGEPAIAK